MRKRKKSTQQRKFIPRPDRPKEARAKERERMAEALAAYQGPITKCPPGRQIERRSAKVLLNPANPPSVTRSFLIWINQLGSCSRLPLAQHDTGFFCLLSLPPCHVRTGAKLHSLR